MLHKMYLEITLYFQIFSLFLLFFKKLNDIITVFKKYITQNEKK
jgi:hypothetical protein